jgi:hypothetical protein
VNNDRAVDPHRPAPDQSTNGSGWTIDTLKEFLLRVIADQERMAVAALNASDQAIEKSETSNTKHFDSVNEFRKTLSDQTQTFMPRTEVAALIKALQDKLDTSTKFLQDRLDVAATSLRSMTIGLVTLGLTTGISVTIAVINLFTKQAQ